MTFRDEVTKACLKALKVGRGVCPSCGDDVPPGTETLHAENCLELRDDVATGL